jgi:hypothetical protein
VQDQPPLCTDHRLLRLSITLLALVASLQEGGTQPAAGAASSSSSSGSSGGGRGGSSSTGSQRGHCSSGSYSSAKHPKSAAKSAAATAAAGSAVAADSLTPAVELSQQLWQQLGLPLCSWGGFVEAWGVIQPQFRSILQGILQTSNDSSSSGGGSSSGMAAGQVVRPEGVQFALVVWLAQCLNYGLLSASTGARCFLNKRRSARSCFELLMVASA